MLDIIHICILVPSFGNVSFQMKAICSILPTILKPIARWNASGKRRMTSAAVNPGTYQRQTERKPASIWEASVLTISSTSIKRKKRPLSWHVIVPEVVITMHTPFRWLRKQKKMLSPSVPIMISAVTLNGVRNFIVMYSQIEN